MAPVHPGGYVSDGLARFSTESRQGTAGQVCQVVRRGAELCHVLQFESGGQDLGRERSRRHHSGNLVGPYPFGDPSRGPVVGSALGRTLARPRASILKLMLTIDRHIWFRVIKGYVLVLAILLSIFSLMAFVNELDMVGRGTYGIADAALNVLLTAPGRMVELAPATALMGSIIGLGELAAGHELIAMLALGISPLRIGWSVTGTGLLLMVAVVGLQESVAPYTDQLAFKRRVLATSGLESFRTEQGFWTRDDHRFIKVHQVVDGRIPSEIEIYEFDDRGRLRLATWAERADTQNPHQWVLLEAVQRIFEGNTVVTKRLPSLPWDVSLMPAQVELLVLPVEILSLSALYQHVSYLKETGQNVERLEMKLWQEFSMPLSTLVMVIVAIPFVFGPLREATAGKRILHGSLLGAAFHFISHIAAHLGTILHLNAALTVLSPIAVLCGVAFWLYRRLG
jgi:lipopolysaccharide export system permease protein